MDKTCVCSQREMCSDFLDAVEEVVRQARGIMGRRPTGRHLHGACHCHMPATCGNIAWHVFHGVAKAVHDKICPSCGQFAIEAISALHDLVNQKLGKPMYNPANFRHIAQYYAKAVAKAVEQPVTVRAGPRGSTAKLGGISGHTLLTRQG